MIYYSKFKQLEEDMAYIPYEVEWKSFQKNENVEAYTYYDNDKRCNIIVSPKVQCVFMHECGHILFQHNKFSSEAHELGAQLYRQQFKKFTPGLRSDEIVEEEIQKTVIHFLVNVAMDFEVNSRLFTPEEQDKMSDTVAATFNSGSRPYLAKDFGFEEGKNYIFYMKKMLADKAFVKRIAEREKLNRLIAKEAEAQIKDLLKGGSSRNSTRNSAGMPSPEIADPEIAQIICGVLKKIMKESKMPDGTNLSKGAILTGNNDSAEDKDVMDYQKMWNKLFGSEHVEKKLPLKGKTFVSLEKALRHVIPVSGYVLRSDPVYYYNRRKHGNSGLLINKYVKHITPVKPAVYILIDCSGSMDHRLVADIVTTLKTVSFNNKSKVVFWDTKRCMEVPYSQIKDLKEYPAGGGTHLAPGIAYLSSDFGPSDTLIVISDFADNIEEIKTEIQKKILGRHLFIAVDGGESFLKNYQEFNVCPVKYDS